MPARARPLRSSRNAQVFDAGYYRRFYLTPATRAMSRVDAELRGRLIAAAVKQLELPVRRILDVGCGLGWFRRPLLQAFPQASYTGVEYSEYLCKRYGWQQGSVVDYAGRGTYDLLICCDVLQYLSAGETRRAIANLARLSRGALYLHVPTKEDFMERVDRSGTDTRVYLRSGKWYRQRLDRHFQHAGFGLRIKRDVPIAQWELEQGH